MKEPLSVEEIEKIIVENGNWFMGEWISDPAKIALILHSALCTRKVKLPEKKEVPTSLNNDEGMSRFEVLAYNQAITDCQRAMEGE
jgi:hypothetical protein